MSRIKSFLEDNNFFNMSEEEQSEFLSCVIDIPSVEDEKYVPNDSGQSFDKVRYVKSILPVSTNYYLDARTDEQRKQDDKNKGVLTTNKGQSNEIVWTRMPRTSHDATNLPIERIDRNLLYDQDVQLDTKHIPLYIEWLGKDYNDKFDWLNDHIAITNFYATMQEQSMNEELEDWRAMYPEATEAYKQDAYQKLSISSISKSFDEILETITAKDLEDWIDHDNERLDAERLRTLIKENNPITYRNEMMNDWENDDQYMKWIEGELDKKEEAINSPQYIDWSCIASQESEREINEMYEQEKVMPFTEEEIQSFLDYEKEHYTDDTNMFHDQSIYEHPNELFTEDLEQLVSNPEFDLIKHPNFQEIFSPDNNIDSYMKFQENEKNTTFN